MTRRNNGIRMLGDDAYPLRSTSGTVTIVCEKTLPNGEIVLEDASGALWAGDESMVDRWGARLPMGEPRPLDRDPDWVRRIV